MRLFIVLALVLISESSFAQYGYSIVDSVDQHIFVYEFIEYLEDSSNTLDFKEVSDKSHEYAFVPSKDFTPDNYNLSSTYWFRVKIHHNSNSEKQWLLELFDQTIDEGTAYIANAYSVYDSIKFGANYIFPHRRFKHKNFIIPLANDHNDSLTYYFKIKANHPIDVIIVIRSYDFFSYYSLNEYFLFGIFYGLIILIALYNLLLFFALQERQYLYFVLYALSIAFFFSSSDGFAYQYVWPKSPTWNHNAYGVFMYLITLFSLLFTKQFLHLKYKAPKINYLLNWLIGIRSLYFLFCFWYSPIWFDYIFIELIPLTLILAISCYFFWRVYRPARLFMLAYFFLFIGAVIKLLLSTGIGNIGSEAIFYYSLNITFLMQLITLSFALGDKVRIIKNTKDKALRRIVDQHEINSKLQTKVNRELEKEVRLRTVEINSKNEALEQANVQLANQADEISKMNQLLDKDNWNLKKESKLEMRKRLLSKGMGYEEFRSVFPDDISCYQYLYSVKWKDEFHCKKCHNQNFSDQQFYTKRCTKCGYTESATSHTIFHNVRFPINKAFYIVHIEISNVKISNTELSNLINLRAATCSTFRQKVHKVLSAKNGKNMPEHDYLFGISHN